MKFAGQWFAVAVTIQMKRMPHDRTTDTMLTERLRFHRTLHHESLDPSKQDTDDEGI